MTSFDEAWNRLDLRIGDLCAKRKRMRKSDPLLDATIEDLIFVKQVIFEAQIEAGNPAPNNQKGQ